MAAKKKKPTKAAKSSFEAAAHALRKAALAYPETREDHPWGETAIKVKDKVFIFMNESGAGFSFGLKLPKSGFAALKKKFAEPTHYGLGKHGWVTFSFKPGEEVPLANVLAWLDESFAAVAPKKILEQHRAALKSQ